jgi:glutathione S-transferase
MKLYISPGACSLSPHIVLREAGFDFELEKVDLVSKLTASGTDFKTINPKGYVPTLMLDDGQILTEGPVIVQYLADQVAATHLAPVPGSMERYRLMEWLNFITAELHKGFSPLFNPKMPAEAKAIVHEILAARIAIIAAQLRATTYITGETFSVADAYLFTVLRWSAHVHVDLSPWPEVQAFLKHVAARPAVHAALVAEGLIKVAA